MVFDLDWAHDSNLSGWVKNPKYGSKVIQYIFSFLISIAIYFSDFWSEFLEVRTTIYFRKLSRFQVAWKERKNHTGMKEKESKNVDLREVKAKGLITNQITYLPIALITRAFLIQGRYIRMSTMKPKMFWIQIWWH